MKRLEGRPFDQWRQRDAAVIAHYGGIGDETCGVFRVPLLPSGKVALTIASQGGGWDHVSVTIIGARRCPTWEEMVFIKRAFFNNGEWAMELHPPKRDNISEHDYCLHLWRPNDGRTQIPLPPPVMVARNADSA